MTASRARVAVLASGRGSNFEALCRAAAAPACPAQIVRLVCNRPEAGALEVAARFGVPSSVVDDRDHARREAHEAAICAILDADAADWVCLAGYMRVLSPGFVSRFAGRMLNIHPSLLPLFPGTRTHERALAAGVTIHGATVHFVTAELDAGPIVAQAAIPVLAGDTAQSLAARLLPVEHRLYAHALALALAGKAGPGARGSTALFSPAPEEP